MSARELPPWSWEKHLWLCDQVRKLDAELKVSAPEALEDPELYAARFFGFFCFEYDVFVRAQAFYGAPRGVGPSPSVPEPHGPAGGGTPEQPTPPGAADSASGSPLARLQDPQGSGRQETSRLPLRSLQTGEHSATDFLAILAWERLVANPGAFSDSVAFAAAAKLERYFAERFGVKL